MRASAVTLLLAAIAGLCPMTARSQDKAQATEDLAPSYQDRLIDDGRLAIDLWDDYAPLNNTDGLPRGLRLDGLWSQTRRNGISTTQSGLGIGAFLATPQYGSFSFEGLLTNGEDTSIATLWQRDMPFDGGWRASNGLGMLNSPAIDLVRFQPRIFLATTPMLGAVTDWRGPQSTQVVGGFGEPGTYQGAYIPQFRRLGGQLSNLGAQRAVDPNWSIGFQYAGANDVTSGFQLLPSATPFSTRSLYLGTSRQDATSRFQFNAIESQNSVTESRHGAWFDGYQQSGRLAQSFGLFYLDPTLAWGNQPVANDMRGGYYRLFFASMRWQWDAGADYVAPLRNESGSATTFLNGSLRHQLLSDVSAGVGANVRLADSTAWQGFAYIERVDRLMTGRVQLNQAEDGARRESLVTFNQTWSMPVGSRLNTTVGAGRYHGDQVAPSNQLMLAAYGGGDIARNLALDLNVQWTRWYDVTAEPTSTTGSLVMTWSILPQLRLIATAYRSQATARQPLTVTSPLNPTIPLTNTSLNDTGAFLVLRFESRAGSLGGPLGGPPGAGAGRVLGKVFLDTNDSGRLEAGEQGAANVTVVLDGRYTTRTDGEGRFEFPAVASGRHQITVVPDNLPLPWVLANDGRFEVDVPVRDSVSVDIPARRMR
ncbi:MAG TPA: carboxypeptidase-like regulatory domain-containing protein [Burkholderiaceae bacterium]|nr:carboxypeptidase-like regulatory domain-containing protein [Burkholderiaceae bacterium]HQR69324.1 carboxypeptidase-like regulatory domain-containing protein [Burkholderiaceae bacterium]